MPEIVLSHPFYEQRLASLDYQRVKLINTLNTKELTRQAKIERLEASVTHWPAWVYRQYDPYRLASKVQQQLQFIESSN